MPEPTAPAAAPLPQPSPLLDFFLRALAALASRVFNDLEIVGTEHVPDGGAVILASNHPTYLDPVFIMCRLRRPVRFLAWERPFRIPVLGWLLRHYGAIPVVIEKPGRESFEAAVRVLRAGEAFGIFPEGGRSHYGAMNPVKSGVARLAMITGAPIVPVTIQGAFRVWPKHNLLPRPGRVRVAFHPPIRLEAQELRERRRDRAYEQEIVERVLKAINQGLLPSLRADRREESVLRRAEVSWSLAVEGLPFFFLAAAFYAAPAPLLSAAAVAAAYNLYLLADVFVLPRGGVSLALRNFSPWLAAAGIARACGFFAAPSRAALAGGTAAALAAAWLQAFRFPFYRVLRPWALAAFYAALLVKLRGLM